MNSLGERMKSYEHAAETTLPRRVPVIIRVDGRAWHTWARGYTKPFDEELMAAVDLVALALCRNIQGAQLAYQQSDEVSVLVHGYKTIASQLWFDNRAQKMVSIAASIASAIVTSYTRRIAHFDARAFVMPADEVANYFVWRQQDWTRNSIQMLAQSLYSTRELHGKDQAALQDMIRAKGQNWSDLPTRLKRGRCMVYRPVVDADRPVHNSWQVDNEIPIFTQDRAYVERHLETRD